MASQHTSKQQTTSKQSSFTDKQTVGSVGIVTPKTYHFSDEISLECGRSLPEFDLVVETYGTLNADKSNAILICHALSGSHHAAGYHSETDKKAGWWDNFIGQGKPIDTNKFFVVCLNNIGSCYGSTGPTSINPAGKDSNGNNNSTKSNNSNNKGSKNSQTNSSSNLYAADFPLITIKDWVKTQAMLSDRLEIDVWYAVIGGSMGGMQALQWSVDYPERLKHCVIIASTPKLSAQNIAFNEVARQSILSDENFHDGDYLSKNTKPKRGLILARMVGHITYLTDEAMKHKFGRDLKSGRFMYGYDVEFQVESYLRYQGEQFSERFDANTYLLMTKALDYFDPTRGIDADNDIDNDDASNNTENRNNIKNSNSINNSKDINSTKDGKTTNDDKLSEAEALKQTLAQTQCKFLVVSFTTDWRFSPERSQEIVNALIATGKPVSYVNIDAPYGHDSFLFDIPRYNDAVRNFLSAGLNKVTAAAQLEGASS